MRTNLSPFCCLTSNIAVLKANHFVFQKKYFVFVADLQIIVLGSLLTCRSRGCWDTVCMAGGQSRVGCRDTAPPCSLKQSQTDDPLSSMLNPSSSTFLSKLDVLLPRGPGSVGSVSSSEPGISIGNKPTVRNKPKEKSRIRRLRNETHLDCWDGPLAGGEPAAGRFQEQNLGSQGLESLCVTRGKSCEPSSMFKSDSKAFFFHFFFCRRLI